MNAGLKTTARHALSRFGFDLRRVTPVTDMYECIVHFGRAAGARTLIDAGANTGQFAGWMLEAGWTDPIVSFEPLTAAHADLTAAAAAVPLWEVAPRAALGRERGSTVINIAGNSQSSSLLPMTEAVRAGGHNLDYVGQEQIDVVPLSDWIATRPADERYVLKLDVQGYEMDVLDGVGAYLDRCAVVHTEMSLQEHYVGEALFPELSARLIADGYRCVGIRPGYYDAVTREILQVDGTFVR